MSRINSSLTVLIREYKHQSEIVQNQIPGSYVRFEEIVPFEEKSSRVLKSKSRSVNKISSDLHFHFLLHQHSSILRIFPNVSTGTGRGRRRILRVWGLGREPQQA